MTSLTSLSTTYKFIDRLSPSTLIYIPGWACGAIHMETYPTSQNLLCIHHYNPIIFQDEFDSILDILNLDKIDLWGFSMGGYVALTLLQTYPQRINKVVIQSCRPFYPKDGIAIIVKNLLKNQKSCLKHFYSQWFTDRGRFTDFFKSYGKDYMDLYTEDELMVGLDFLGQQNLYDMVFSDPVNLRFFQGKQDRVAPIGESMDFFSKNSELYYQIIDDEGHFFNLLKL